VSAPTPGVRRAGSACTITHAMAVVFALCASGSAPAHALSWVTRTWQPVLGPPIRDSSGIVRWTPYPMPVREDVIAWRAGMPPDSASLAEKVRAWRVLSSHPILGVAALRRLALCQIDLGDSSGADSSWARIAAANGLWNWDAVRARVDLAMARGRQTDAESLLVRANWHRWPEEEKAEWWIRRLDTHLISGDSAGTIALGREALLLSPSVQGLGIARRFDLLIASGDVAATSKEESQIAQFEWISGNPGNAARHYQRAYARKQEDQLAIWTARTLREAGQLEEARTWLRSMRPGARDSAFRAGIELQLGLVESAANRPAVALIHLQRAAALGSNSSISEDALWNAGQLQERLRHWKDAARSYRRVGQLNLSRKAQAPLRAGLMSLAAGDELSAIEDVRRSNYEGAPFWQGVLQRRVDPDSGNATLRRSIEAPYHFQRIYSICARESLGLPPWPTSQGVAHAVFLARPPALDLAEMLLEVGLTRDAKRILDRWTWGDVRLGPPGWEAGRDTLIEAARLAYAAGSMALGIDFAWRAILVSGGEGWVIDPWMYPPAIDSVFERVPEASQDGSADRSLLRAIVWQESKFDPVARSRSNALGLLQLKVATAGDMARLLHEPPPDSAGLLDPVRNLRYGRLYFDRLLRRFGGDVPLALAAYNAGPTNATRWLPTSRMLRRRVGGVALDIELMIRSETEDYVKKILAARAAYRALRPTTAPAPR
jgi:tetratricopeptide (TPR) repeat protein